MSAPLTILADENIPCAREAFGTLGTVRLKHGRAITTADLADVDMLAVRSITRVDAALVGGTRVRFVGTATSGNDHLSLEDLDRLGVAHYTALGCNANAVAEYMAAAWLTVARRKSRRLRGLRVGIVGVGHVGSRVAETARALGMTPVLNDPPKHRETGLDLYRPLDELLDCDIITCHTPLTCDGPDPTVGLIGARFLSRLKPGAWFCNAGRGGVVDEAALHAALDAGRIGACVLDVWDGEPVADGRLVARVDVATPHIAGYSLEGKLNGTMMVYEAACRFFGLSPAWDVAAAAPPSDVPFLDIAGVDRDPEATLATAVTAVYPVQRDVDRMRAAAALDPAARGRAFDDQRKTYPTRREFRHTTIRLVDGPPEAARALRALHFTVSP